MRKAKITYGILFFIIILCTNVMANVPEVILKQPTYEGFVEYFKECNKDFISTRSKISYDADKEKKKVYLTFDDGPNKYYKDILDVLKKYNVKATFFITYCWNNEALKQIKNEGHAIAIHTATHVDKNIYKDEISYMYDLYCIQKFVYDNIGEYSHYLRFPGGSNNTISQSINYGIMKRLVALVQDLGFEYYDWNVSTGDSTSATTKEQIIEKVKNGLMYEKNNYIVLMHDLYPTTIEALPEIIEFIKDNGFELDVINDNTEPVHLVIQ